MKIQLITNAELNYPNITVSKLSAPKSLDEFELNVIDLSYDDLWENDSDTYKCINSQNDLISIQTMVEKKSSAKIIYAFPQNVTFYYDLYRGMNSRYLKKNIT